MNIAFFGSSLVSAYWNGAATYYRGIIRALARARPPDHVLRARRLRAPAAPRHRRPAVGAGGGLSRRRRRGRALRAVATRARRRPGRQGQRRRRVRRAAGARGARRCSGPARWSPSGTWTRRPRWTASQRDPADPFRAADPALRPGADLRRRRPVVAAPTARSARATACRSTTRSIPTTHHPVAARAALRRPTSASSATGCPTARRGWRSSSCARRPRLPERRFLLGGSGWGDKPLPANVRYLGHVYTRDHNAFNCTPAGGAEHQPRQHGRATASRRPRACSRRPAPAPA